MIIIFIIIWHYLIYYLCLFLFYYFNSKLFILVNFNTVCLIIEYLIKEFIYHYFNIKLTFGKIPNNFYIDLINNFITII